MKNIFMQCLNDGTLVATILHVSQNGMTRRISLHGFCNGQVVFFDDLAEEAGYTYAKRGGGVVVRGGGMDMQFKLVSDIVRIIDHNASLSFNFTQIY